MLNFQYDKSARWSDCNATIRPNLNGSRKDHVMAKPNSICSAEDCSNPVLSRGLCGKHYHRARSIGALVTDSHKVRSIRVCGDVAYIPLTRGYEAIIDADDAPLIESFNWHADVRRHTVYGRRSIILPSGKQTTKLLHQYILVAPDGFEVDHISGDGLDNRRVNLRLATRSQNQHNQRLNRSNTSGFKGVQLHKLTGRWMAMIKNGGKRKYLGCFGSPEQAHEAYRKASEEIHGPYGRLR